MTRNFLFVLPFNELSGSVVSAVRLKKALEQYFQHKVKVDFCMPETGPIQADVIIPQCRKNPLTLLKARSIVKSVSFKYEAVIYFTVRFGMLCPLFTTKEYIYVHEVDIGKGFLQAIVRKLINLAKSSIWVVNPKMKDTYPSARILPNISIEKQPIAEGESAAFDFLMISNLKESKGIYILKNIAKKLPNFRFCLLTNSDLADACELDRFITNSPVNLCIETDQSKKVNLLSNTKYLLNLSTLEETFGLTLLEALAFGVIPISFKNMGSTYCLPERAFFIDKLDPVSSLIHILSLIEKDYLGYRNILVSYVDENFSVENVCQAFVSILKKENGK